MQTVLRRGGAVIALAALAAGIVWALFPAAVSVETAPVTRGRFVASVNEDGKTRIRERYVITAPLGGRLTRVGLKAGDRVATGDAVATIVPAPAPFLDPRTRREAEERLGVADAAVERAKAAVERAQAQAEQTATEFARARTLLERGVSTAQTVERAELARRLADRDLRAAQFQFEAAEHEREQARTLIARYDNSSQAPGNGWDIVSPVSGLVLKIVQESETVIPPGGAIMEIGDPRDLEVVVDVLSTSAVEIRQGADVMIENWGGKGGLTGVVRRVEPAAFTKISTLGVEEQRVNVLIDITSPAEQWAGLGDAFQIDAKIVVFAQDDATVAPSGALFRRGEDWFVFTIENGRAMARPVIVTRRSGQFALIASGLAPGEQVVIYPSDRVASGARVNAR